MLFVVATVWRCYALWQWDWTRTYYALDTRMSGLILGSALAMLDWRPERKTADLLAGAALLVLFAASASFFFRQDVSISWGGVANDVASCCLIAALTTPASRIAGLMAWAPLARLGRWSYGIYLAHYPIVRLLRGHNEAPVIFLVALGASVVLAGLSYELFERRAIRWLQSLGGSRTVPA